MQAYKSSKNILLESQHESKRWTIGKLDDLSKEKEEDTHTSALSLKVIARKVSEVMVEWTKKGSRKDQQDFQEWVQDQLRKGGRGLYKFSNQENAPTGAVEEVVIEGGVLCSQKELMDHRTRTWEKWWGATRSPKRNPNT